MQEHYSKKLKKTIYRMNLIIELLYNRIFEAKTMVEGGTGGRMYMGNDIMAHPSYHGRKLEDPEYLKELILELPEIPASFNIHFLGNTFSFEERKEIEDSVKAMFYS